MKITPNPLEFSPGNPANTVPDQASLGAKSKGFAKALEHETGIDHNPVTPKPLQSPSAVVVTLSPAAVAAIEGDAPVKETEGDSSTLNAFDPLPPVGLRNKIIPGPKPFESAPENEVIPAPLPPTEAPVKGKSSSSPAFQARKAIEEHPELGDLPFGQVVSLLARGLPLPIDPPPTVEGGEETPPTDEAGQTPTDTPPAETTDETTENAPAPAPAPAPTADSLLTDVEENLIRTVLA